MRKVYVKQHNTPRKKAVSLFSYIFLTIGALLLFWSFYPILSFEIYSRIFLKNALASPVSKDAVPSLTEANSVLGSFNIFSNNLRDYTKASLWFPNRPQGKIGLSQAVKEYSLSIPRLDIKDAKVVVGGEDLTASLVHTCPSRCPENTVMWRYSATRPCPSFIIRKTTKQSLLICRLLKREI